MCEVRTAWSLLVLEGMQTVGGGFDLSMVGSFLKKKHTQF